MGGWVGLPIEEGLTFMSWGGNFPLRNVFVRVRNCPKFWFFYMQLEGQYMHLEGPICFPYLNLVWTKENMKCRRFNQTNRVSNDMGFNMQFIETLKHTFRGSHHMRLEGPFSVLISETSKVKLNYTASQTCYIWRSAKTSSFWTYITIELFFKTFQDINIFRKKSKFSKNWIWFKKPGRRFGHRKKSKKVRD